MTPSRIEALLQEQRPAVTRRAARVLGDPHLAQDVCQETFARAWRSAPSGISEAGLRSWLHRTATNLAIDELRRRTRRGEQELPDGLCSGAPEPGSDGDARAALAAITPHQRLLLLLRYEAGLTLREVGALLDLGEDAARKRVARARRAFAEALRELRREDDRPVVVVLLGIDDGEAYGDWLEKAGARVRFMGPDQPGLDLAGADALVLSGSCADLHAATYGEEVDPRSVDPNLGRDQRDLRALRLALRDDVPFIGVCRGAQLLTVLFGGSLAQHIEGHDTNELHPIDTAPGSLVRRILGRRPDVVSEHHQAVRRRGRGLCVGAVALDGTVESVEVPGRRFALGTQWHPERGGGDALASALLDAASA